MILFGGALIGFGVYAMIRWCRDTATMAASPTPQKWDF
jgi:hypothetical protein